MTAIRKRSITTLGTLLAILCSGAPAVAGSLRKVPNLQSITFFERTGGTSPDPYTFSIDSAQLLNRGSYDFQGTTTEHYDVFYSDALGNFDVDGEYMTIEGVYGRSRPAGGGLNLAEMRLNFADGLAEYANVVTSFRGLGDNAILSSVKNAVDGNLLTHTTMGNTIGQSERLSITLGFASSSEATPIPEPSFVSSLLAFGLFGAISMRKGIKHKKQK